MSASSPAIRASLIALHKGESPSSEQISSSFKELFTGSTPDHFVSSFLTALHPNLFTPSIVAEAARVMRQHAVSLKEEEEQLQREIQQELQDAQQLEQIQQLQQQSKEEEQLTKERAKGPLRTPVLDIVGTGGDGLDTFNVSTAASFLIAACGQRVVKHGNRSSSSKCGSADLLEATGAVLSLTPKNALQTLKKTGYSFLFAPLYHPAMKHVSVVRKSLGFKTIFNVLGPLTNPFAPITYQVTGVYSKALGPLFAASLRELGVKRAAILHSFEGMDEISPAGPSYLWLVNEDDEVEEQVISPADFGLPLHPLTSVASGTAEENAKMLERVFTPESEESEEQRGSDFPQRDYVLLNAAVALVISEKAKDWKEGVKLAREGINSGAARQKLREYIELTQQLKKAQEAEEDEKKTEEKKETILEKITRLRRDDVEKKKKEVPLEQLLLQAVTPFPASFPSSSSLPPPSFFPVLPILPRIHNDSSSMALAAEIKRASPSLGMINPDIVPASQAFMYYKGGASLISVLTEPLFFKGSLADLQAVRKRLDSVENRPGVLLKDFVVDFYQIVEARVYGADTVLLIVAILSPAELSSLIQGARSLGMEPLVEVANKDELEIALQAGARFVGVNNRNLHTFEVDMRRTEEMVELLRKWEEEKERTEGKSSKVTLAALSGISSRQHVERYEKFGVSLVLVGESLMRSADPEQKIRELLGKDTEEKAVVPFSYSSSSSSSPLVKICGLTNTKDAIFAAEKGANLLGMIFVNGSKREVQVEQAKEIIAEVRKHFKKRNSPSLVNPSLLQAKFSSSSASFSSCPLFVGVFVNKSPAEVNAIADSLQLDFIQLHGDEKWEQIKEYSRPVIKVVPVVPSVTTAEEILGVLAEQDKKNQSEQHLHNLAAILLDTKVSSASGGTGVAFDHSIAAFLSKRYPVFVAGGLTEQNVSSVVSQSRCYGVDVSSGVEKDGKAGEKDEEKVEKFLQHARQYSLY